MRCRALLHPSLALLLLSPLASAAELPPDEFADIGTEVGDVFGDGLHSIDTSVTGVSYAPPVKIHRGDLTYWETAGSMRGIGWGGLAIDTYEDPDPWSRRHLGHYAYEIPFVLRWPQGWDGVLVVWWHGAVCGPCAAALPVEFQVERRIERSGNWLSDAMLAPSRRHASLAVNLSGMKADGTLGVVGLPDGNYPGRQLTPTLDVPVCRDTTLAAKRLLAALAGKPVAITLASGFSGGGHISGGIVQGNTLFFDNSGLFTGRTGGDFVRAYQPQSGLVLDGVIPIGGGWTFPDPEFPLAAPIMVVTGQVDFGPVLVEHVLYLGFAGADMAKHRAYEIVNMPHGFPDAPESLGSTGFDDHDHLQPVIAAAMDALLRRVRDGTPMPVSAWDGDLIDLDGDGASDQVQFPQAHGQTTTVCPHVEDPAIDSLAYPGYDAGNDPFYVDVFDLTAALPRTGALHLPKNACRLGGLQFPIPGDGPPLFVPFADMAEHWKSQGEYQACITSALKALAARGLYDRKLGGPTTLHDRTVLGALHPAGRPPLFLDVSAAARLSRGRRDEP